MTAGPRLRQVALVASDCARIAAQLQQAFGWPEPFHDPGVGAFGLTNAVFTAGDTFVEVVAPERDGTTAGRYLERRGGDSGYMAIFQMPDLQAARRRVADAGVRVVWTSDHADIAGTHLHPKDVPGAIVSLDWADPPESWRWAGPPWTGGAPAHQPGGLTGITVEVEEPGPVAEMWASLLGVASGAEPVRDTGRDAAVHLLEAGQSLRFVRPATDRGEGITEVRIAGAGPQTELIAGVRFVVEPVSRRQEDPS
ncbi:MAG: hypothetical protein ACRDYY_01200 [Acidimicrobiales bacterium]